MKLEYEIAISGREKFLREFRSVEGELDKAARRGTTRERQLQNSRVRAVRQGAGQQERIAAAVARKTETDKNRAAKLASSERLREERRIATEQARAAKLVANTRIREERRVSSEQTKNEKWRQLLQNRHFQQAERERKRSESSASRNRQRAAASFMGGAARVSQGTIGLLGTGLKVAAGTAGITGAIAFGNAAQTQMSEQAMASRLANQGGNPQLKGRLLSEAQNVEGFTGSEVLSGLGAFTDVTGDLDTARKTMGDMAKLALATGSSLDDVAAAAGNFSNNLREIEDPGQRAKKIMEAMRALAGQGMAGAVELKDLASGGAVVGAAAGQYTGDPTENIKKAGVLAQAARQEGGASSADEALTSLSRFNDQVIANADKLEGMGVKAVVRGKGGEIQSIADPRTIIADVLQKTKGDLGVINDLFDVRGSRVVRGFSKSYQRGGRQGVLNQFDELMGTELDQKNIDTNVKSRLSDSDMQFQEATKKFNAAIGEKLIPELTKLIPKFQEMIPAMAELTTRVMGAAHWLAENPFAGASAIVGGFIAKELATAGIGAAMSSATNALLGSIAARLGVTSLIQTGTAVAGGATGTTLLGTAGSALTSGAAAAVAGGAAVAGAAAITGYGGYQYLKQAEATEKANAEQQRKYGQSALARYTSMDGMDSNALNRNLPGSPAAIQAAFGGPGSNEPIKLDSSSLESVAKELSIATANQRAAAESQRAATADLTESLRNSNRNSPILNR